MSILSGITKRAFDIVFSLCALAFVIPVCLLAYPVVRLESPGPFFFRQVRVGRHGRPFRIFKIRTMYTGSEGTTGVTCRNDARITPAGRFLRQTKLDELPQFFNVLAGHMSVVGPRPGLPAFQDVHPEYWKKILAVRPGITDLTSVQYFEEESLIPSDGSGELFYRLNVLPKKQKMYLDYLDNRSFFGDLGVVALTVRRLAAQWATAFPGMLSPILSILRQ